MTKQRSKQNITRDIEIKNNLTVTRGELGGDNEAKVKRIFMNNYKGHMDKRKVGWDQSGDGWVGEGVVGGKCREL